MTEGGEFAMWLAVGMGQLAFWGAMYPVLRGWGRRIEGKGAARALEGRLAALEARGAETGETELLAHRIMELEERLDFAERLLARGAEPREADLATPTGGSA